MDHRSLIRRWLPLVLGLALVVGGVPFAITHGSGPSRQAAPGPVATSTPVALTGHIQVVVASKKVVGRREYPGPCRGVAMIDGQGNEGDRNG